jgi:hypothetical protein
MEFNKIKIDFQYNTNHHLMKGVGTTHETYISQRMTLSNIVVKNIYASIKSEVQYIVSCFEMCLKK